MPDFTPIARFEIEYGLDEYGEMVISEAWVNLFGDGGVPMIVKAGMLQMAQQSLVAESFGLDKEDDERD